ncbi:MAG: Rpn family recombination-promoting nuclease/putative transposase [Chitinispirillales bacterium]|jgi:predicted transposase/invertase (TIGR01784 family)|nr:Rpn family recombination-promoting nuclease/putative transposase [Chitinispirillales bacterium]
MQKKTAPKKAAVRKPSVKKAASKKERTIVSFDYAVKYLFRDKKSFGILSGFLSELLKRNVSVKAILESESNKANSDGKTNRVDLKAQIDNGEFAVFEIQFLEQVDFLSRVLYGVSKAITEQVPSGSENYDIKKVYSINIAYYNLGAKHEYLFNGKFDGFKGVNFKNETIPFAQTRGLTSGLNEKSDIHPEYYLILPEMFDEHMRTKFDEWIYLLKNSAVRSDFKAAGIKEAALKLDLLKMSTAERKAYEKYQADKSSVDSAIYTAKRKGKEEGILQVAKKMKERGKSLAEISEDTGLSIEQIKRL